VACLLDCYGPSYFFYPKKEVYQTDREYKEVTDKHHDKFFNSFAGDTDLEVLMKMWNATLRRFKTVIPNKQDLSKWCTTYSLNNKKITELFNVVKQCCFALLRKNYEVELGVFSEKNVIKVLTPVLEDVYQKNVFVFQKTTKSYYNPETREYYKLNLRAPLVPNPPPSKMNPPNIVALSLAELPNKSGGPPTRLISLYQPL